MQDMFLVVISFLVFIAVAVIFMSSFSYKTRTTLALAGVFVVALGIVAGWGWGMIFGESVRTHTHSLRCSLLFLKCAIGYNTHYDLQLHT